MDITNEMKALSAFEFHRFLNNVNWESTIRSNFHVIEKPKSKIFTDWNFVENESLVINMQTNKQTDNETEIDPKEKERQRDRDRDKDADVCVVMSVYMCGTLFIMQ